MSCLFRPATWALVLIGVLPLPAFAQWTPAAGSLTGLPSQSPTEGRQGAGPFVNPASLSIWDGPVNALDLFQMSGDLRQASWLTTRKRLLSDPAGGATVRLSQQQANALAGLTTADLPAQGHAMTSGVRWVGLQSKSLSLAVQTTTLSQLAIPERAGLMLRGDASSIPGLPTPTDSSEAAGGLQQQTVSTAIAGLGSGWTSGRAKTWTGISVKGSWIHNATLGQFRVADVSALTPLPGMDSPLGDAGLQWQELSVRNVFLWGADLGLLVQTDEGAFLSISASNVYQRNQMSTAEASAFTRTQLDLPLRDGGQWMGLLARETFNGNTLSGTRRAQADSLADMLRFTPTIRIGGSQEIPGGRLVLGYTHALDRRRSLDAPTIERWNVGFASAGSTSLRLGLAERLTGERVWSAGAWRRHCQVAMGVGGQVLQPKGGLPRIGVQAGVSIGSGACRLGR